MYQYLVDHAIKNVWCNPEQDNQLIIAAKKVTRLNGELNTVRLMNRLVNLPTTGKRYHVYQVGQILPVALGLLPIKYSWEPEKWIKFSDAMSDNKLITNIYTIDGINIPRFSSYYMFTDDKTLVFAIEVEPKLSMNIETDVVYVRLYSNAYYQSQQTDQVKDFVKCKGSKVTTMQAILDHQAEVTYHRTLGGHTQCYVNGFLVNDISPVTASIGDVVEFVHDSSVKRVVTFTVNSLASFTSILDTKQKYLLHHLFQNNDTIDYQDDIDIYIVNQSETGTYKAAYYHRNNQDSHRMVTHRDYSVVVDYFDYIANSLMNKTTEVPLDIRDFKLQVVIRNSGYYRPLIQDNNRVFELYKLSNDKILQALTGVNSTLPLWKAENLENSFYTKLMRTPLTSINRDLIQKAYGYNSISKIVGETPSFASIVSGRKSVTLPYGLYANSTAYEYDVNGYLLGYHHHVNGTDYEATNGETELIEVISGLGTVSPSVVFGQDNIPLPTYHNYRVYRCFLHNGEPNNEWQDITGSSEYVVQNNVLVYTGEQYDQFLMIRDDSKFLAYDLNLTPTNGNIFFTLAEQENRGTGPLAYTLPVPLGELDIFLNGKSLINGLDYVVKFPKVYIINKSHLKQPALTETQNIHVRFTGFCKSDLKFDEIDDFGFIQHGYLSNNSKYDVRDDKVLRITVDGSLKHRSHLEFSEEHDGVSITNPNNGKPYQVKDIVVPLKELVDENTYSLRDKSMVIDQAVANYMTIKLPQPERNAVSAIPARYPLVSPFMSRIIDAVKSNELSSVEVTTAISDMAVINLCAPFENLLQYDPINLDNDFDFNYVTVLPHRNFTPINVTMSQYKFLSKVAKLYGNDQLDISSFLTFNT